MPKLDILVEQKKADPNLEEKQTAIFYGDSFSGKTWGAAQLARRYKLLWLDLEDGWKTVKAAIPPEFYSNIIMLPLEEKLASGTMAKDVYAALSKPKFKYYPDEKRINVPTMGKEMEVEEYAWEDIDTSWVVVLDTFSALSDSSMQHYLGPNPGDMVFKKKEFSHYDFQGLYLNNVIAAGKKLPCHFVVISHQEQLEQEDGTDKLTPTGGTRNFSRKIPRKFDHAVHFKLYNKRHVVNTVTTNDNKVIAGSRNNVDISVAEDLQYLFSGLPEKPAAGGKHPLKKM